MAKKPDTKTAPKETTADQQSWLTRHKKAMNILKGAVVTAVAIVPPVATGSYFYSLNTSENAHE